MGILNEQDRYRPENLLDTFREYSRQRSGLGTLSEAELESAEIVRREREEKERKIAEYNRLLEQDLVGIQQWDPFLGTSSKDPSAGYPFAPADFFPGTAAIKKTALAGAAVAPLVAGKFGPVKDLAERVMANIWGRAASLQDITRRTKSYETALDPAQRKAGEKAPSLWRRFLGDWYRYDKKPQPFTGFSLDKPMGGVPQALTYAKDYAKYGIPPKFRHAGIAMPGRVLKDLAWMQASPQRAYIWKTYGFGPSISNDVRLLVDIVQKGARGDVPYKHPITGVKITHHKVNTARNELRSQIANPMAMFTKYLPNDPRGARLAEGLERNIFPMNIKATAEQASSDPRVLRSLFDLPDSVSDQAISSHLAPHMIRQLGIKGDTHFVIKPLEENPAKNLSFIPTLADDGKYYLGKRDYATGNFEYNDLSSVYRLWKDSSGPVTKKSLLLAARQQNNSIEKGASKIRSRIIQAGKNRISRLRHEYETSLRERQRSGMRRISESAIQTRKRKLEESIQSVKEKSRIQADRAYSEGLQFQVNDSGNFVYRAAPGERRQRVQVYHYNIDRLKNVIHDDGDYLSIGGQLLSEDRMLAHIQNRFMMDKRGGDAIWTYFDQMKLGGAEGLDEFLDFGSVQNFIAAEVYPVTRKGGIETLREVGGIRPAQSLMEAESNQATIEALAKDIMGKLDEKAPMSYIIKRTLTQLATLGAGGYAVSEAVRNEN